MYQSFIIAVLGATLSFSAASPDAMALESPAEPAKDVSLRLTTGDWDSVQKLIEKHRGRIVLVDVWTTTCATCVAEFPKFMDLKREFGDRIALIAVNCDYDGIESKPPAYYEPRVREFLEERRAAFDNVLLDVAFIDILEKLKLSSTPAILVYGRDGKLLKRFDNDDAVKAEDEFSIEDVSEFVKTIDHRP